MKRLTDSDFVYTPSHLTNIRETFEKHRANEKELKAAAEQERTVKGSGSARSGELPATVAAPVRLLRKAGR